jgi:hypothetical protein
VYNISHPYPVVSKSSPYTAIIAVRMAEQYFYCRCWLLNTFAPGSHIPGHSIITYTTEISGSFALLKMNRNIVIGGNVLYTILCDRGRQGNQQNETWSSPQRGKNDGCQHNKNSERRGLNVEDWHSQLLLSQLLTATLCLWICSFTLIGVFGGRRVL